MKLSAIAGTTLVGGTLLSRLALGPARTDSHAATPPTVSLPVTGLPTAAVLRIKHGLELEGPVTPSELYEQYVPPPPPPPTPAPRVMTAVPWTPPAGYHTFGVPIYHQTR